MKSCAECRMCYQSYGFNGLRDYCLSPKTKKGQRRDRRGLTIDLSEHWIEPTWADECHLERKRPDSCGPEGRYWVMSYRVLPENRAPEPTMEEVGAQAEARMAAQFRAQHAHLVNRSGAKP